jgi:hypothetical protein
MPASSTADLKQLIRTHLIADADVAALVGDRVYSAHLSDADAPTVLQDGPLVVFEMLSGVLRWHGAVAIQTFDIYGYSKRNNAEASRVYDAVTATLQHECVRVTGIDLAIVTRETQRPLDGYNQVLDAWFVRGRWTVEAV